MTEVELSIPFAQAIQQARQVLGPYHYYLHNQVGSGSWSIQNRQGRVYLQVQDPQMATFFILNSP